MCAKYYDVLHKHALGYTTIDSACYPIKHIVFGVCHVVHEVSEYNMSFERPAYM